MNKLAVLIFCLLLNGCDDCEDIVNIDRNYKLNCIVDSIYENPRNRYNPTIRLNCAGLSAKNFEMNGYYYPVLNESAEVGDRVTKDSNSLLFKLHKKDNTVIEFFPICDGEKIK